jgi:hypothetical protein
MATSAEHKLQRSPVDKDDEGDWNEYTPVTDMNAMFKKVGQTSAMIRQLVEGEMPALRGHVKEAIEASRDAQREAYDAKTEATLAKERIEDVRQRVEQLEPLKVDEAKTQARVNGLTEKISAGSDKRRWLTGIIVGLVLALLSSAGTAIWWASQVDASVRHESGVREQYDQGIVEKLGARPTRDEVLTRNELKDLRDELVKNRQPSLSEWMDSLTPAKQAAVKRLIGGDPTAVQ